MENKIKEIWKDIKGYEGLYQVSNLGNIKNTQTNKQIKKCSNLNYYKIGLYKKAIKTQFLVHRLVAEAFIPNPENKPQVNHINGIKTDNRVENLEWVTQSQNMTHASKNNLIKKVKKYKIDENFLYNEYIINEKSINQIVKELNNFCSISTLNRALKYYNIPIRSIAESNICRYKQIKRNKKE